MKTRNALLVLSLAGLLDAFYLVLIKIFNNPLMCPQGIGDCWTVNTSRYGELFGIPVAVFGMAGYAAVIFLVLVETNNKLFMKLSLIGVFALALFGSLFSIYLTYLEIAVIKAICPFCVVSAILMFTIFGISIARLAKSKLPLF
jgi:uncharacterized membrane protein